MTERMITNAEVRVAKEIIEKHERQHNQYEIDKNKQQTKLLLGRYFIGPTSGFSDENGINIYRVLKKGSSDCSVLVENWKYAHSNCYSINEECWYGAESINRLKEISRKEYVNEINRFLGKLGLSAE